MLTFYKTLFSNHFRGEDNPKKLELHPQQIVAKQFEGPDNVYPLVVSIEPESFTNVQKHANEG